jgi:hypothetical protein
MRLGSLDVIELRGTGSDARACLFTSWQSRRITKSAVGVEGLE